jgi:MFS family permease
MPISDISVGRIARSLFAWQNRAAEVRAMWEKLMKPITQYRGLPRPVYVLFFSRMVNALGMFVGPMMTLILTVKIGFSSSLSGTLITVATLGSGLGLAVGGKLADRFGRKRTMLLFQGLAALLYLACGFLTPADSAQTLQNGIPIVALLMASPFIGAMSQPAAEAMTMDLTEPKNRKESFSLIYMGFNLGFAVGPTLAGLLFLHDLRWVFAGDALTTLISLALIAVYVPDTKPQTTDSDSMEGRELEKAVTGSAWKVLRERPILPLFALIYALYQFCYSQWGFLLPLQMNNLFVADGARNHGLLGSLNGIIVIALTPVLLHWMKKMRPLYAISLGGALFTLSFFLFGWFDVFRLFPPFLFGMFVFTVAEIVVTVLMPVFIADQTPSSHRGRISAAVSLIAGAGWSLGFAVMGFVNDAVGIRASWNIVSAVMALAVVAMLLLRRLEGSREKEKDEAGAAPP